jgi:hypothetical protein
MTVKMTPIIAGIFKTRSRLMNFPRSEIGSVVANVLGKTLGAILKETTRT